MKSLKNAVLSLLMVVLLIASSCLGLAAVVALVKLCANHGAVVFSTLGFLMLWAGINYEMKEAGLLK